MRQEPELAIRTDRRRKRRRTLAIFVAGGTILSTALSLGTAASAAPDDEVSLFPSTVSPSTPTDSDRDAVQLGLRFSADVDGAVSGVKFYKGAQNTGTHTATLWASDGSELATAVFEAETSSGWQTARFDSPVRIEAGEEYVASYLAPNGSYAVTTEGFDSAVTRGDLTAPESAGVYSYGTDGFPDETYRNSNYFVDVVFTAGSVPSAPTPSPVPTPTVPDPGPQTPAEPSDTVVSATLRQVDGGTDYYGRFTNGLPTSADYFPSAVWFESVTSSADTAIDKRAGINTYVALTNNSSFAAVERAGMYSIPEVSELDSPLKHGALLNDEVDMIDGPGAGYEVMEEAIRNSPPGVMTYANFGKGVSFWETDAEAAQFLSYPDLVSVDNYWFSDPNICGQWEGGSGPGDGESDLTEAQCRLAANYGWTVDRARELTSPQGSKPVWNFVELGHPFSEDYAPTITAPEIRAAVWSGIIHGARGTIYFNHNFGGSCLTQHVLRDDCGDAIRPTVTAVNRQVAELAPVLNAPFVDGLVTTTGRVDSAVKVYDGSFYVLAGSAQQESQSATFTSECTSATTATVLGENRTLPVVNGSFTDTFADGNAVHLYQLNGGTCGVAS